MKIIVVILLTTIFQANASIGNAQTITIKEKGLSLETILNKISSQSNYDLVYNRNIVKGFNDLDLNLNAVSVEKALETCFRNLPLTFSIENRIVVIRRKAGTFTADPAEVIQDSVITGKVIDALTKQPISGVTVSNRNGKNSVQTNLQGTFRIEGQKGSLLSFSYLGYERKSVTIKSAGTVLTISLQESVSEMKDVVITGIVNVDKKAFTGTSRSFNDQELGQVTNNNVLSALRALDPSFQLPENINLGSNPNVLPEVVLRGGNSLVDTRQAAAQSRFNYEPSPNAPLFIIDGFETTLQRVNDLDMTRIQSVTILKDASATAMYGSQGANGVIVIELKRPKPGKLTVSYNLLTSLETPDISGYDLLNAREKFELEDRSGVYTFPVNGMQNELNLLRAARLKAVNEGVNTDWLAKPLQNGFGQKHTLLVEGGAEAINYGINFSYDQKGTAMKGSGRNTTTANSYLGYRYKGLRVRNDLTLTFNKANNSPYGTFSQYSRLNPYWTPYDENGEVKAFVENVIDPATGNRITVGDAYDNLNGTPVGRAANPLYNATLNLRDQTSYRSITNNFEATYDASAALQFQTSFSYTTQQDESDVFLPSAHTSFNNLPIFQRGSYAKGYGQSENIIGNLTARFAKNFNKHQVNLTVRGTGSHRTTASQSFTVVGFSNQFMDELTLGSGFLPNSRPSGTESIIRSLGTVGIGSYSYDNRYFIDATVRVDGASNIGSDKRFAPFWSVGGRWNLHNEQFLKGTKDIQQLVLKYSVGTTGTQGFTSSQALTTSQYFTDQEYRGVIPTYILGYGNPLLAWSQTLKQNLSFETLLFDRLSLQASYFLERTKGSNAFISTAPSSGFSGYYDNMGDVVNKGYEIYSSFTLLKNTARRNFIRLNANFFHVTNKIEKISSTIRALNNRGNTTLSNTPLPRYAEGQSRNAIWGIQSLGIDPATGSEVFVKRDGTYTTVYNPADQVIIGDSTPDLTGSFGTNVEINGIGFNIYVNFSVGGQAYNQTLVDRVENVNVNQYNVDRRVATERWRNPGDISLYRAIVNSGITNNARNEFGELVILPTTITYTTSRFIQRNNWIEAQSAQLYYRFTDKLNRKLSLQNTKITLNVMQPFRFASIKRERGLDYPFAHNVSLQFSTTF
ncbi:SusC/RagA family TonB-linked outer membrane protein [Pedobacter sp. AW31-3R]|uniref:SusC/RagA family TonB-linked outer membrane protein n=1 Tax=Pedobacter sp. AW31-3R TaxID=3445781 RepID=UPI003F9FAC19